MQSLETHLKDVSCVVQVLRSAHKELLATAMLDEAA